VQALAQVRHKPSTTLRTASYLNAECTPNAGVCRIARNTKLRNGISGTYGPDHPAT